MKRRLPSLLGLAAFATLPSFLLSQWMDWEIVDPRGYLAELAWTPALLWAQLKALSLLDSGGVKPRSSMVLQAFSAELLLALRFCGISLLGLLPALFCLSSFGWVQLAWKWKAVLIALALAGLTPAFFYVLRRLLAPPLILFRSLSASAALQESARMTKEKSKDALRLLLFMAILSLCLEGLAQLSPASALLCLPTAFLARQALIHRCYRKISL